jgi:exodeoxyribonuclease V
LKTPTEHQFGAIKKIAHWYKNDQQMEYTSDGGMLSPVLTFGGLAGSGKSSCLPNIVEQLKLHVEDVAMLAPTGKAAKVMREKLRLDGLNIETKTIHSAMYLPKALKAEVLEKRLKMCLDILNENLRQDHDEVYFDGNKITIKHLKEIAAITKHDLDKAWTVSEGPKFTFNVESKLFNKSLIIVDEASMVGSEIAADLRSFGIPIIAIGDPGQLPPVADTPGFNIASPDVFLTEIHRQAKDNPIIWLSMLVREGGMPPLGRHGDTVNVIKRSQDNVTCDMDRDLQVIVGTNANRWNVTAKIRKAASYDSDAPMIGEKLICCRNSKITPPIVNGSIVEVTGAPEKLFDGSDSFALKYEDEEGVMRNSVVYQGLFEEHKAKKRDHFTAEKRAAFQSRKNNEHFDFAHAITCHKSQGSQWPEVCVHDESAVFREDAAKWAYTAYTRASERLTVVV